ncbi:MAG: hypothetical protein JW839_04445 [Candidatus Lokiarchaeota archaeon]|nr:hypothetical protein [Candidatus Lokiarchaeota archaeon]
MLCPQNPSWFSHVEVLSYKVIVSGITRRAAIFPSHASLYYDPRPLGAS